MRDVHDEAAAATLTRRRAIKALGASGLGAAIAPDTVVASTQRRVQRRDERGLSAPLVCSSATALARAIRTKRVSAEDVTAAFLARIREVNPKIHAVVADFFDTHMKSLEAMMLSQTAPYRITGWPAAVVRVGTSDEGLPIGLQVVGKPFQEHVVLAVARFVEQEFGGFVAPGI